MTILVQFINTILRRYSNVVNCIDELMAINFILTLYLL